MLHDMQMIVVELPREWPTVNLYPLGDLHIGSADFDEQSFKKWKRMVMEDPYSKVVLIGDMMDNGIRTSKTNPYDATLTPRQQKEKLRDELEEIKDKIIGAISGNHERRTKELVDMDPLYDVMAKLDLEDYYRPNMCFIKVNVGARNRERQVSYGVTIGHGAGINKAKQFGYQLDGCDIFITGHTHQPKSEFHSKIVMDTKNNVVRIKPFTHVTVPALATIGGYSLRAMYSPQDTTTFPILKMNGSYKEVVTEWA